MLTEGEQLRVVAHARQHFPDLVPAGAARLSDLPLLDRERARPWYGREVPDARTFHSTGTSGYPKGIGWTAVEDEWYLGEKRELMREWLAGCERGFVSVAVGHNADSARQLLLDLGMTVHDAGLSPLDLQVERVSELDPHVLYCSPTILWRLIEALRERGLPLRSVRRVITNGEVLSSTARATIERELGLGPDAVMDTYGSTEVGTIAATCPHCGLMHFMDGVYPEAVALPEGEASAVPPGGSVLALSSVKRTSFPVVRLVTYDVVRGLARTQCQGRDRHSIQQVVGRCDEVLNYGELFSAHDLADLIDEGATTTRWLAFDPDNRLILVVDGAPDGAAARRFETGFAAVFPLHQQMIELGLIPAPQTAFLAADYDRFLQRAGLGGPGSSPPSRAVGKGGVRVRRRFDPAWLDGLR